jgi:hypothetical protein
MTAAFFAGNQQAFGLAHYAFGNNRATEQTRAFPRLFEFYCLHNCRAKGHCSALGLLARD